MPIVRSFLLFFRHRLQSHFLAALHASYLCIPLLTYPVMKYPSVLAAYDMHKNYLFRINTTLDIILFTLYQNTFHGTKRKWDHLIETNYLYQTDNFIPKQGLKSFAGIEFVYNSKLSNSQLFITGWLSLTSQSAIKQITLY